MTETITWTKKSGDTIDTNDFDATVKHCEALGWKRNGDKPTEPDAAPAPRRGRPPKKD